MKTLFLVRHGKSSWSHSELPDEKRPLVVKGENNIKYVAEKLLSKSPDTNKGKPFSIDLIITSHALRALESAKIIAAVLKYPDENIKVDKTIYTSNPESLYDPLFELDNKLNTVMLVGHNPTITYFANKLLNANLDHLPTSALLCISLPIDNWHDVIKTTGKEIFRIIPKSAD